MILSTAATQHYSLASNSL